MKEGDPYTYPGSSVLRNKLDITDATYLAYTERELVTQRASEGVPTGRFDLDHLRAIHRHLFQDIYDWGASFVRWKSRRAAINSSFAGSSKQAWVTSIEGLRVPIFSGA